MASLLLAPLCATALRSRQDHQAVALESETEVSALIDRKGIPPALPRGISEGSELYLFELIESALREAIAEGPVETRVFDAGFDRLRLGSRHGPSAPPQSEIQSHFMA